MSDLEGLDLPQLLERLHDLAAPAPVSYFPATPAWYYLGGVLLLLAGAGAGVLLRRRRRNRYRRVTLREFERIERELLPGDPVSAMRELAVTLRRSALSVYPRAQLASLYGAEWGDFLQRSAAGAKLGEGVELLSCAAYLPAAEIDRARVQQALAAARRWVRRHRV